MGALPGTAEPRGATGCVRTSRCLLAAPPPGVAAVSVARKEHILRQMMDITTREYTFPYDI